MNKDKDMVRQLSRIADALENSQKAYRVNMDADSFIWRAHEGQRGLYALPSFSPAPLEFLRCVERQKQELMQNLQQFVCGLPANHMLLWGAKGTGKSSLVKAAAHELREHRLKIVEVSDLQDLPEIIVALSGQDASFLLYCDDLQFTEHSEDARAAKVALEGSLLQLPENLLLCATSNRRHLMPEWETDNDSRELHPREAVDEKISLAERFGLCLSFHPFTQEQYLEIVSACLDKHDMPMNDAARQEALRWALRRGSRSGRVAEQFSRAWAGQAQLTEEEPS